MSFSVLNTESGWCEQEFAAIDLGDKRLNQRYIRVSSQLLNFPETSKDCH